MKIKALLFTFLLILLKIVNVQSQAKLLEKSYKKQSKERLKKFFTDWNSEIPPISNEELLKLSDIQRATYQAFYSFYKPFSIDSLGGSEWGKNIYPNVEFLIIQNYIRIYLTDKIYTDKDVDEYIVNYININVKEDSLKQRYLERKNGRFSHYVNEVFSPKNTSVIQKALIDSIVNFRPQIDSKGATPLYMNAHYKGILNTFLGNKYLPLGTGGFMNPAHADGESQKRKNFLENYIKIWYGHWGGYWQLLSYPEAYCITFDKQMKYAKIDFRMIYEGGEAILEKYDNKWILLSAKRTWIE